MADLDVPGDPDDHLWDRAVDQSVQIECESGEDTESSGVPRERACSPRIQTSGLQVPEWPVHIRQLRCGVSFPMVGLLVLSHSFT